MPVASAFYSFEMLCTGYILKEASSLFLSWSTYKERVPQKTQCQCFFTEHLKVQEKKTFTHALWVNTSKSK